jgi:ubiquinone/menaquinone biosynthesis C-methylase UbiE
MTGLVLVSTADKIERAYDAPPWWYDLRGFFILTFSYRSGLGAQLRFFGEQLGSEHLEAAVGSGSLFALVLAWRAITRRRSPRRIVGFDLAPAMLAGARRRFADRPWIELLQADAARLDVADETFDSANLANAAHCLPDLDGALRELHRVLRPGGRLALNALLAPRGGSIARRIATAINDWGMTKGILHAPLDRADVRARIERAGFVVERSVVHGNCLDVLARKPGVEAAKEEV